MPRRVGSVRGRPATDFMKFVQKYMRKKYKKFTKNNGLPNALAKGKQFVLTYQGQKLQIGTRLHRGRLRWNKQRQIAAKYGGAGGKLVASFIHFYANDSDYKKFFNQNNGSPTTLAQEYIFDFNHDGKDLKMVAKVLLGKLVWVRDNTEKQKEFSDRYAVEKQERQAQTMMAVGEGDTGDRLVTYHASTHHVAIENDKYLEPNVAHPGGMFNGRTNSSDTPKVFFGT